MPSLPTNFNLNKILAVPGPAGPTGAAGPTGPSGGVQKSVTSSAYTQPAIGSTVAVTVDSTAWMFTGQFMYLGAGGLYSVSSITDATHVVVLNLGDASNTPAGGTVATAQPVSSAGRPHVFGSAVISAEESVSSTSYTGLFTPGPAVQLVTGVSVTIDFSLYAYYASGPVLGSGLCTFAISGATTLAASDSNGLAVVTPPAATYRAGAARKVNYTGLTPGLNVFTLKYRADPGGPTIIFGGRGLSVTRND